MAEDEITTKGLAPRRTSTAANYPNVQGRCPACDSNSLFLGHGGYVTCDVIACPDPTSANDVLHFGTTADNVTVRLA